MEFIKKYIDTIKERVTAINKRLDQRTKNIIGLVVLVLVIVGGLVMCHVSEQEPIFSFLGRDQFEDDDDDDVKDDDDDDENTGGEEGGQGENSSNNNNNSGIHFEEPSGGQQESEDGKLNVGGESVDDDDEADWSIPF